MNLRGKVAIVTGSAEKGTGRTVARRFAREGISTVVSDINDVGGREAVALIEVDGGRAAFCHGDVRNAVEIITLVAFAETTFGGLNILVNNVSSPYSMGFLTGWGDAVAIEFLRPCALVWLPLKRCGGGAIVNIGSTSARGPGRKHSAWPGRIMVWWNDQPSRFISQDDPGFQTLE